MRSITKTLRPEAPISLRANPLSKRGDSALLTCGGWAYFTAGYTHQEPNRGGLIDH